MYYASVFGWRVSGRSAPSLRGMVTFYSGAFTKGILFVA